MDDLALRKALASLPHGPEFRFLDTLLALEPGLSGTGVYTVRGDEPFLKGHFPGSPLFPGVLLVEAGAQLAGTIAQTDPHHPTIPNLKLSAVHGAKFTGSAVPGQSITFNAKIVGRLGHTVQADVVAYTGDLLIMTASVILSGTAPESLLPVA